MDVVLGSWTLTPQSNNRLFPVGVGSTATTSSLAYARVASVMPKCVIRGLSFYVGSYSAGSSVGVVLQKNGVDTALRLVTAGGATGWFENATDQVSFEAGDTAVLRGQAGVYATLNSLSYSQSQEGPGPYPVRYTTGDSFAWGGTIQYYRAYASTWSLEGLPRATLQLPVEVPGSIADVEIDVRTNSRSVSVLFALNVNGSDVGAGVVVPPGTTGKFALSDPPYSMAVGDAFCFVSSAATSGGSFYFTTLRYSYIVAGPAVEYSGWPGQLSGSSAEYYLAALTPDSFQSSNDAAAAQRAPFDFTVEKFRAYFSNSVGELTLTLQKNGVDTGLVLTKPAGANGEFHATGGPVSVVEGDRLTYKLSPFTGVLRLERVTTLVTNGSAPPPVVSPPSGELTIDGAAPLLIFGQQVLPVAGALSIEGLAPVLTEFFGVRPLPGALELSGAAPALQFDADVSPLGGALRVSGGVPRVLVGITVGPGGGSMAVEGFSPGLFTQTAPLASQVASMALGAPAAPPVAAGQVAALALGEPPAPPVRASQAALLGLAEVVPHVAASQAALLVLAHGSDCVTAACQLWTIYRRDGKVFRYTSHDQPVKRGPFVYSPCRSLDPSASENASTLGSVGDIELTGIIDDDGISEDDLYGGLFDDAYVTVDLYSWGDARVPPRRLAAGWTGELSQGVTGFQMQVLGPGARLGQQALVQMVTPACRWVFGDARCGVNVESMKVAGTVIASPSRGRLKVALPAEPAGRQWANGRIRFVSGPNAGQVVETKSVNFATGEVVTWVSPGFLSDPGDAVELLPGCDLARDGGCTLYKNVINFGGFPDVPGSDALLESPDAKY